MDKIWKVVGVVHHDNGDTTLTLQDEHGNTLTEDYPPGVTVSRVVTE